MSCGRGDQGALGHKDCNLEDCLKPRLVEELLSTDTLSFSCGESHVVALTSDGEVFAWGNGKNGRLGTGNEEMWYVHVKCVDHNSIDRLSTILVLLLSL